MSLTDYFDQNNASQFLGSPNAREAFDVARLQKDITAQHKAAEQEISQQEKALLPASIGLSIMHEHGLLDYDFKKLDARHLAIDITLKQEQVNARDGVISGARERFIDGSDARAVPQLAYTRVRDLLDRIESNSVGNEVAAVQAARADINRTPLFGRFDLANSKSEMMMYSIG